MSYGYTGCPYCGNLHLQNTLCPRVRSIEYAPDGKVRRIEFHAPLDMILSQSHRTVAPFGVGPNQCVSC